jgi:hypothetical protein
MEAKFDAHPDRYWLVTVISAPRAWNDVVLTAEEALDLRAVGKRFQRVRRPFATKAEAENALEDAWWVPDMDAS